MVGDHELLAQRPPTNNAPETQGLLDTRTRQLFSSDCFGAILQRPAETASAVPSAQLREGLTLWASIDAPWLPHVDPIHLRASFQALRQLSPCGLLSSHLPPAAGVDAALMEGVIAAQAAPPFVGPDQAAVEQASRVLEVAERRC